jgi:hypothetical protein
MIGCRLRAASAFCSLLTAAIQGITAGLVFERDKKRRGSVKTDQGLFCSTAQHAMTSMGFPDRVLLGSPCGESMGPAAEGEFTRIQRNSQGGLVDTIHAFRLCGNDNAFPGQHLPEC